MLMTVYSKIIMRMMHYIKLFRFNVCAISKGCNMVISSLCFLSVTVHSQNLIPNPSFEYNTGCPGNKGNIELVDDWWSPFGHPVYFHACNNYKTNYRRIVPPGQKAYNEEPVIANSGVGYVGIYMSVISVPSHHDYLMCKLNRPLKKDSIYDVEMMVRLGNVWKYIDYIGMFFSHDKYEVPKRQTIKTYRAYNDSYTYKTLDRVSLSFDKDTVRLSNDSCKLNNRHQWIKVKGQYTSKGGEQYVTIGNFCIGNRGLFNNNIKPENPVYVVDGHSYLEGDFSYSSYQSTFYYIDDVYIGPQSIRNSKVYQSFESKMKVGESLKLENIYFETGKATLEDVSYSTLRLLQTYLIDHEDLCVVIEGHTDNIGTDEANVLLSQQRAEAIIHYLNANGISSSRMKALGYGHSQPIADNALAGGRQLNRRVEFTLTKKMNP